MLKLFTPARSLAVLAFLTWILVLFIAPRHDSLDHAAPNPPVPRAIFPLGPGASDSADTNTNTATKTDGTTSPTSDTAATPTQGTPTPTQAQSSPTDPTPTQTPTANTSQTSATDSPTSGTPAQTSQTPTPTPSNLTPPPSSPTPEPSPSVTQSQSTDSNGDVTLVFVTVTPSQAQSSASASPSANADQDNSGGGSKGVGTSTIVGLSVAGGIALIGIIGFVIWKFTRKRFSDDFDDNEAIKWPDLNAHGNDGVALPIGRSGNAGFETNSEVNLTRPDSRAGSTYAASAAASAVDLYAPHAAQDPYAVPPLPHLNPNQPNQPYRDDPDGAYYDPYHGPVPGTFADGGPGGENIPMTQINRARSPGPQMAYAGNGRMSPGPGMAYAPDGRVSPAPQVALSGRASPGPQAAYGYGGRQSPGPNVAYGH